MKKILIFMFLLISVGAYASVDLKAVLQKLDNSLSHKDEYEKIKTDRIDELRSLLDETQDSEVKYQTMCKLFDEYKSYRYDSASVYANRCLEIAEKLNNKEYIIQSKCNMAFSLVSAGISIEANKILSTIDITNCTNNIKQIYYFNYYKLWNEEANRIQHTTLYDSYSGKARAYLDSLCMILNKNSAEYWNFKGSKLMCEHKYAEALAASNKALSFATLSAHEKAMLYAEQAWAYVFLKNEDKAIECFAESAIFDNESATREITALYLLAQHIVNKGEAERAIRYVHLALDDINFYDANLRKVEIGGILPQIEQERYNIIRSERNTMFVAVGFALIAVLAILFSFYLVRKKNRLLTKAEEQERKTVEALEEANRQLSEANNAKTEYIAQTFLANADYIAKLSRFFNAVERQLTTHQYDKIRETISESRLESEREQMYAAFDTTFLGIYPDFVNEYNKLFDEKDRRTPEEGRLTPEMRIFALIRMGITDSEKIGSFLDYSVHTVNTYKTRIKNRSIVNNNQFEPIIKRINSTDKEREGSEQ